MLIFHAYSKVMQEYAYISRNVRSPGHEDKSLACPCCLATFDKALIRVGICVPLDNGGHCVECIHYQKDCHEIVDAPAKCTPTYDPSSNTDLDQLREKLNAV